MVLYYSRVRASELFTEIDGNQYAWIPYRLAMRGAKVHILEDHEHPRMVMANDAEIKNGEAWVLFAKAGEAIAQTENLPFAVSMVR